MRRRRGSAWVLVLTAVTLLGGCRSKNALPQPGSAMYRRFTAAFYTGLAGLQVGDDVRAETGLAESALLVPGEPAAWVDWGLLALRQRSYATAAERLERARALAPKSDAVEYLLGLLASEQGDSGAAISHLERAVVLNGRNVRAMYQLASEVERQGDADGGRRFEALMQQILVVDPGNLAALLELSRSAAKTGDRPVLETALDRIKARSRGWPAEVQEQLAQLEVAAKAGDSRAAATRSIFLRNVLMRVPEFREGLSDLKPAPGESAEPMIHFLRLANPPSRPAVPDARIRFQAAQALTGGPWQWTGAVFLDGSGPPALAVADQHELRMEGGATMAFPGDEAAGAVSPESVLAVDFNYDFKTDLVLAGAKGVSLMRQDDRSHFSDVTPAAKLPSEVVHGRYTGAWALDVEADGDLDVLLGRADGPALLLRNNGDGSFATAEPFPGVMRLRQMVWVDLNGDGLPDAALLDGSGQLHIFLNRRSGNFVEATVAQSVGAIDAIAAGDAGSGDTLDLLAVERGGSLVRFQTADEGLQWSAVEIARLPHVDAAAAGGWRLLVGDLDNNGAVDLVLTPVRDGRSSILLGNDHGGFDPWKGDLPLPRILDVADLKGDGRPALVGLTAEGASGVALNTGSKPYHWQTVRPRAKQATGDQRINSFGVGGEIEVRAGLLLQKQPINRPALHFGLGEQTEAEVARILWPNGSVRAEFALKADQQIVTEQRLKGSCPFLFAWDGKRMGFVKDSVPWGSAIGLRINALGSAKIAATEEWYKIAGDQLKARDGFYDLRVTGELWESYFYDAMALMTVDHPAGVEVFTDERFDVPAVKLAVTATLPPQPVERAVDDRGQDVTETVRALDGRYLDTFGRGQYQGVTRDHFVELTLPEELPVGRPLWLVARGWLHPSDSSINIALSQGGAEKPKWLSLEVPDGRGGWRVARPNLGFPAGRNKICLIDLTDVFPAGTPHRLRLRTNLEVYWDQIEWAEGAPEAPLRVQRLSAASADLHYRGFSAIHQANDSSPEIPEYDRLSGSAPRWRDLEGFYTRFGDVRELLAKADDRYVVMNAGDEMEMRFAEPAPPPAGWLRDFVIAGDGWIKDGDYNSTYSETVLPYPHHGRRDYNTAPGRLEDDWMYQHHREDWMTYQTRYVTPETFAHPLRGRAGQ